MDNSSQVQQTTPSLTVEPEPKMTPVLNLSLYYDMYRISIGEVAYIAKVFPTAKISNFQRQKEVLSHLDHPSIIKPFDFSHTLVTKLANTLKNELILFPEQAKGDLLEFVRTNGCLSQHVVRYFTNQVVSALSHAYSHGILHPNLLAQNVLLSQNMKISLCGWSNSIDRPNINQQDLLFSIGELIISLCISRRPFVSRDTRNDPFAKFLHEKYIHKFWEQIEKVVKKFNKNFQFSNEIKEVVSSLFLGRLDKLEDILSSQWLQTPINENQVKEQLKIQLNKVLEAKENRKNKVLATQKQEKQIAKGGLSNLHRKPSRSQDLFEEEYNNYEFGAVSIEQKGISDRQLYFTLYDKNPRLIISHLRARLREAERDEIDLINPLLLLKEHDVVFEKSAIKITCTFGWNYSLLVQKDSLCGFDYAVNIALRQEGKTLQGRLELNQSSELSEECINQMNRWLVQTLQHYD